MPLYADEMSAGHDIPGPVTRFFEPVGEVMIRIGELAEGSLRYGIALGGAATLSKVIYCSSFGLPLSALLRPGSVRILLGMACAGMAIGLVRVVHDWRTMSGPYAQSLASAAIRPGHSSPSAAVPDPTEGG